jgi:hypothetical protein
VEKLSLREAELLPVWLGAAELRLYTLYKNILFNLRGAELRSNNL